MCRFKSGICLKDRVFVPDYDSHSRMLEELHIEDDFAHASKVFVRIKLSPADGDKTSDVDGWKLNVDQDEVDAERERVRHEQDFREWEWR